MSLRDEHLQQALKHAPDSELAPSELVRKNVLAHAKQAGQYQFLASPFSLSAKALSRMRKPHGHWLAGLLPAMKNWQWAGMGSVAVAFLALLMLREQLPPEMTQPKVTQPDAAQKVLAQNKAEAFKKEERVDMAAAPASIQAEAPARTAGAREKAKAEAPIAPQVADETVVAELPEVVASAPPSVASQSAPAEQTLSKQDKSADAKFNDKLETAPAASAPASDAVASAEQKSEAEKPAAAAKKSVTLVDAGALGVAKANQDIHVGVLRILVADWPADKPLLDEATGYRVEIAANLAPEELAAYNQIMRDWFKTQH